MRRPIGIAIIAILNFLSGLYLILAGLGIAGSSGYTFFANKAITETEKSQFLGLGMAGVIALVLGVITVIVAVALWRLKTWAWYLAFLITAFNLAQWIYNGNNDGFARDTIIHIVVYGILALYLLAVKNHFGNRAD